MTTGRNYKWEVLALLWVAFFLNQADRQVFNIVLPLLKADLQLTDVQLGSIATIFNLVFAVLVPVSGYLSDIYSRKWILVIAIIFWSTATIFTGFAGNLLMLILFRSIATGGGEAFFGPANYSMLASYHTKTRAFAMSVHQTSYYAGIILCGFLAGYVAERWGWKSAFYVFGTAGIIHGLIMMWRLKDNSNIVINKTKVSFVEALRIFINTPTVIILSIAYSGLIFVLVGYLTWAPTYLYEKFSMSLSRAGFHSMFYTHAFAFVGILIAGKVSDRIAKTNPGGRLLLQSAGLIGAVPFILLIGNAASIILVYIGFAGFGFARAFFDANTYSVLYDVIPEKYQASISSIQMMIGFGVGSFSPIILGYIKPAFGLSVGFTVLAGVWVICGTLLLTAYRYYFNYDYQRVR